MQNELFDNLKDVFELATGATAFINEISKLKKTNKKQDEDDAIITSSGDSAQIGSSGNYAQIGSSGNSAKIGSSGDSAKIGSSGDYAKIGSSGDYAKIGSSGDYAQIGSSGYYAKIGSSGYSAQIGSSGYYAQIGSSGDYAKIGSSGNSAQIGSSGDSAKIGSSGDSAQIGSSGNSAQIGSSGNSAKIDSTGSDAVIAAIGRNTIAKAKKGSWLTLAEYNDDGIVRFVKTEYVDGEIIKEDVFYTLYNKKFHIVEVIDDISTIILKRHKNIIKGITLFDKKPCWIFEKEGIYAHGGTVKQAYFDWLFKTSDRDVEQYRNLKADEIHDLSYWVVAYRTITGACSFGTNNYLENNKDKYKDKMTLNEVIKATKGQYGAETFKEFFLS